MINDWQEVRRKAALEAVQPPVELSRECTPEPEVRRTLRWWFGAARQFIAAHAGGFVRNREREYRLTRCAYCPLLQVKKGRMYCGGRGMCGCPQSKWWPFATLNWGSWLRNLSCPIGRWEVGQSEMPSPAGQRDRGNTTSLLTPRG